MDATIEKEYRLIVCLSSSDFEKRNSSGEKLAGGLAWRHTDLDRYIEYKIGRSLPQIMEDGQDAFRFSEAEALRDLVAMSEIGGESLVLSLDERILQTTDCRRIICEKTLPVWMDGTPDGIADGAGIVCDPQNEPDMDALAATIKNLI